MGTFRRQGIEISLNDTTKPLIEKFIEVLKEHKLYDSMIAPTGQKDRKGLWSIVVTIEYLLDKPLDATTYTLLPLEVQMDDHVQLFMEEYIEYWNDVLDKDNVSIEDRQATRTAKPLITIKEIFVRACADALGQDMTGAHDGEVIVDAMKSFVEKIGKLQEKLKIGLFLKEHTNTMLALKTTHPHQLVKIQNLVRSVKLLHLNKSTLLNASNLIKKIEINTMRLILAELSELESIDELSKLFDGEYVKRGVKQLENKLIEKNLSLKKEFNEFPLDKSQSITQYIEKLNLNIITRQELVLDTIKSEEKPSRLRSDLSKKENVQQLYELLNDTYYILEMMAGANLFNVLTSWIGIVTGCIKMDGYAELFDIHASQVLQILKIDGNQLKTRGGVTTGIIEFNFTDGVDLSNDCKNIAKELRNLQSREIITSIIKSIEHTINLIVNLQKQSPVKFQKVTVINVDLCANFLQAIKKEALPRPIDSIDNVNKSNNHQALSSSLSSLPAPSSSPSQIEHARASEASSNSSTNYPSASFDNRSSSLTNETNIFMEENFLQLLQEQIPRDASLVQKNTNDETSNFYSCFIDAYQQTGYAKKLNLDVVKAQQLCNNYINKNPKDMDRWREQYKKSQINISKDHVHHPLIAGRILCKIINQKSKKKSFELKVVLFDNFKTSKLATIACSIRGSNCDIKDYKLDKLQLNKFNVCLLHANQNHYYIMKSSANSYSSINNINHLSNADYDYDLTNSGRDSIDYSSMATESESLREVKEVVSNPTQNIIPPIFFQPDTKTTPAKVATSAGQNKSVPSSSVSANQQLPQLYSKTHEIAEVSPLVALVAAIIDKNDIVLFRALFNSNSRVSKQHFENLLNTLPDSYAAHLRQLSQKLTDKDCDLLQLNDKHKEQIFECTLTAHNPWAIKILLNTEVFTDTTKRYVRDKILVQEILDEIAALVLPPSFTEKPILAAVLKAVVDYEKNIMPQRNWSKKNEVMTNRKNFIALFKSEHEKASRTGMLRHLFTLIQLHTDYDKNYNGETRGFRGRSELYDALRSIILPYFKTAEGKVDEAIEQLANQLRESSFSSMRQGKFILQYNPEQQMRIDSYKQQSEHANAKLNQANDERKKEQEEKRKENQELIKERDKMKKECEAKDKIIDKLSNQLNAIIEKLEQLEGKKKNSKPQGNEPRP
ncbi:MAG: hypothetical protein Q8M40_09920 [Legionella sp.]|nr:hypothetical protein [Legionella sp.]